MNHKPLGKLEQLLMEVLWETGDGTVREVMSHRVVAGRAYTTIMTTLSRLHRKGLLERVGEGNAVSLVVDGQPVSGDIVPLPAKGETRVAVHAYVGDTNA